MELSWKGWNLVALEKTRSRRSKSSVAHWYSAVYVKQQRQPYSNPPRPFAHLKETVYEPLVYHKPSDLHQRHQQKLDRVGFSVDSTHGHEGRGCRELGIDQAERGGKEVICCVKLT